MAIETSHLDDTGSPPVIGAAAGDRGVIQSIERAADVLSLLDQHTSALTPALVSERLGLNRTTAHRYLQSLQASGFLNSAYGPGQLLDQLSALVSVRQQILSVGPSVLRELSDRTGLTAVLSFLGRSGAVVTHVEEAHEGTILITVRIGTMLELKAAQSRALFAFQSDPTVVARAHAGLSPAQLRGEETELARVRRDRLAWADLDRVGVASVAAPVFGSQDVQAAIGIIGTSAMLVSGEGAAHRVAALRDAAEKLSSLVTP